jgi:hypothetical protein
VQLEPIEIFRSERNETLTTLSTLKLVLLALLSFARKPSVRPKRRAYLALALTFCRNSGTNRSWLVSSLSEAGDDLPVQCIPIAF